MAYLPLANILHHKLRSLLSSLGIALGVCMLVTLAGLSRGSLYEVARRWEAVDADLIVLPRGWGSDAADKAGAGLSDRFAEIIEAEHGDKVQWVVPVFTWPMKLAGQDQRIAGVAPEHWPRLVGGRSLTAGRMYDPNGRFADWLTETLLTAPATGPAGLLDIPKAQLSHPDHDGLELVIDTRLARAGGYEVGDTVTAADHEWEIVGIAPAGALARVFMPRRTAQYLFGAGSIAKSTLMFVKLADGAAVGPAARAISQTTRQDVVPLDSYRQMLISKFGILFPYVDTVNAIALGIAFLFIMVTLYTMVLQRTRELAILKANGASNAFLVRQVLAESMLLTLAGTALGIALSFAAGWGIETARPLLTVTITWRWIAIAVAAALAGSALSAVYPAWRATRVDMLAALTVE